jgi:uncharacterized LabA/DUF88 family protein
MSPRFHGEIISSAKKPKPLYNSIQKSNTYIPAVVREDGSSLSPYFFHFSLRNLYIHPLMYVIMTSNRCAIFIDGGYLEKILKNEFDEQRIDFEKLSEELAGPAQILRTYYYNCMPFQDDPPTQHQKELYARRDSFMARLQKLNRYEVKQGKLVKRACENCQYVRFEQKRLDVLMAVDLVRLSATRQIDQAVLVTGDSDFVPAVRVAKMDGVLVQLYYSQKAKSDELYDVCDERVAITKELIEKVKLHNRT